jgi:hypothetical protein
MPVAHRVSVVTRLWRPRRALRAMAPPALRAYGAQAVRFAPGCLRRYAPPAIHAYGAHTGRFVPGHLYGAHALGFGERVGGTRNALTRLPRALKATPDNSLKKPNTEKRVRLKKGLRNRPSGCTSQFRKDFSGYRDCCYNLYSF